MRMNLTRSPFDRLRANEFWRWIPAFAGMTKLAGMTLRLALLAQGTACALLLVMTVPAYADCVYMDGGYCVSEIAEGTVKVLGSGYAQPPSPRPSPLKGEGNITLPSPQGGEGERGVAFLNYYESLWNGLVQAKLAVKEDMDKAFVEAGKAGGTKIGGVNLVVLSARTLQQLVDKNILTKEEAQGILNGAHAGLPRPAASQ